MTNWNVIVKGDAYSMPLYDCDDMTEEEVQEYLYYSNDLEPEEYELYSTYTEE